MNHSKHAEILIAKHLGSVRKLTNGPSALEEEYFRRKEAEKKAKHSKKHKE